MTASAADFCNISCSEKPPFCRKEAPSCSLNTQTLWKMNFHLIKMSPSPCRSFRFSSSRVGIIFLLQNYNHILRKAGWRVDFRINYNHFALGKKLILSLFLCWSHRQFVSLVPPTVFNSHWYWWVLPHIVPIIATWNTHLRSSDTFSRQPWWRRSYFSKVKHKRVFRVLLVVVKHTFVKWKPSKCAVCWPVVPWSICFLLVVPLLSEDTEPGGQISEPAAFLL